MFGNLRLVATDKFREYRKNTELFLALGNEAFAARIRAGFPDREARQHQDGAPWLLYHSWRQPRVPIDASTEPLIRDLMAGRAPGPLHDPVVEQINQLGWVDDELPVDLDQLVMRANDCFLAIQNDYELRRFLERVRILRPRVVVEIGSARGGMLYCFSQLAAPEATLVSIDLPGAPNCGGQTETEREVFATFCPVTQRMHFIPADSHLAATRERLADILSNRTIDLLFIDGDHSYSGCRSDFEMYQQMVGPDGLIVFHDICMFPDEWPGSEVGILWQQVKATYGGEEIIDPDGVSTQRLLPGQRWRWGLGLVEARNVLSPLPDSR